MKISGIKFTMSIGEYKSGCSRDKHGMTTIDDTNVSNGNIGFEINDLEISPQELIQIIKEASNNMSKEIKSDVNEVKDEVAATSCLELEDNKVYIDNGESYMMCNSINNILDRCVEKEPAFTNSMAMKIRTKASKIYDTNKLKNMLNDVIDLEYLIDDSKIINTSICGTDVESRPRNYTSEFSHKLSMINYKYQ